MASIKLLDIFSSIWCIGIKSFLFFLVPIYLFPSFFLSFFRFCLSIHLCLPLLYLSPHYPPCRLGKYISARPISAFFWLHHFHLTTLYLSIYLLHVSLILFIYFYLSKYFFLFLDDHNVEREQLWIAFPIKLAKIYFSPRRLFGFNLIWQYVSCWKRTNPLEVFLHC